MPKFSVYTPTHDPRWIRDCFDSLVGQTTGATAWEWVILVNGPQQPEIPADIASHPRVIVRRSALKGIGALKGKAVEACTGEILVELDHDDRLAPNCLEELERAHAAAPGGFYYSDFASVFPNGAPETFASSFGWEQYEAEVGGTNYLCQRSFPPCPRSLCEIWYAPNHVRAWSRVAYDRAGGYDAKMEIGDDHDLVCRTYLTGLPFVHLSQPLYLYRRVIDPKTTNSFVAAGDGVTQANYRTMNKYMHPLVVEWCRRQKLPMLDLGGAHNSPKGFIPVDSEFPPTDLTPWSIGRPGAWRWPAQIGGDVMRVLTALPDSSVGCVRAFDFIEHLPRDQMVPFMNQAYRVLVPGGFLLSATPSTDGRGAFQDPTHTNFLNQNSFWYYTNRESSKYLNGKVTCRFQAVRLWTECPSAWHKENNVPYVYADLLALKGFKHIGPIHI